jgi:serine/threonine-protein kinase RsbW
MEPDPPIILTVPADTSYVSLARAATAAVCARAQFTLDRLDDIRLAVDEACALVIADAPSETQMRITFSVAGNQVSIEVDGPTLRDQPTATNTFAWTVLTALVDEVDSSVARGHMTIRLHAHGIESVAL